MTRQPTPPETKSSNPPGWRPQTPNRATSPDRTPPGRPAADTSSNLPVNPPQVGAVPDSGNNLPIAQNPPQPTQSGWLERPASLPALGNDNYGAVPRHPGASRVAPLRSSLPRAASRLGR